MAFSYLNYARYGIAKLSGLNRLSKVMCETRDKFLKYPQDMIDYYNSISKVIYGSDSVTDVTDVGDKNGFRAQSVAKLGEIFKGLSGYDVPLLPRARGSYYPRVIQKLNIFLDGFVEAQNTMQIESCIVESVIGKYLVTLAYVPRLRYIVDIQATYLGVSDSGVIAGFINNNADTWDECTGIGCFSRGWVHVNQGTEDQVDLTIESFSNSTQPNNPDKMSRVVNTNQDGWYYKRVVLKADQPGYLYRATMVGDLEADTYSNDALQVRLLMPRRSVTYNPELVFDDTVQIGVHDFDYVTNHPFRYMSYRQAKSYEVAINDSQAMLLMHVLSNDILAEINIA